MCQIFQKMTLMYFFIAKYFLVQSRTARDKKNHGSIRFAVESGGLAFEVE